MSEAERPAGAGSKVEQCLHRTSLSRAACENGQVCLRESEHVPRDLHMTLSRPACENGSLSLGIRSYKTWVKS